MTRYERLIEVIPAAAALEYLIAEIVEIAGNQCREGEWQAAQHLHRAFPLVPPPSFIAQPTAHTGAHLLPPVCLRGEEHISSSLLSGFYTPHTRSGTDT
jgi:hypothetical protein